MKTEPKDLIDLCTNCTRDACPTGECPEYEALERKLRGKPRISLEKTVEKPLKRDALTRYNAAIDALEALVDNEDLKPEKHSVAETMCKDLRRERILRFEGLVDWHAIAENGTTNGLVSSEGEKKSGDPRSERQRDTQH